ncbi:MAG: beta/alpha barrel domain-containing protein [Planctomycetota bacterium]
MKKIKGISEPNLMEDMFPHVAPPHIVFDEPITEHFDGEQVTLDPADLKGRDIHITDTTFRDGQQARPPYTVDQIAELYDLLARLGGPKGVIRQTEFFVYSKKDRAKAFENYTAVAKEALSKGIRPRCHLEDVSRADIEGFVLPYVQELMRISEEVDDSLKVKIRLCDTMGFGVPYPGTALPRSVPKLVLSMIRKGGVPSDCLEWHGHNDFHKVMVNGVTAWLFGANALNCTLLGIGERTGNPPLEGTLIEYMGLKGDTCGVDTRVITEIASYYRSIGTRIPAGFPLIGDDFNKTRAGIHADGLFRDERIYSIFDTVKILDRPPEIVVTDKSGTDGVHLWVNNYLGLHGDDRIKRTKLVKISRWVADQYDVEGRTTAISDHEMAALVKEHLPEQYAKAAK